MAFVSRRKNKESMRQEPHKKPPKQRNYMKSKQPRNIDDPDYRRLVETAELGKAPFAQKTKGFYRFARNFPDRVDAQGYRINAQTEERPITPAKIVIFAVGLLFLFSIGFILMQTALGIAHEQPAAASVNIENTTALDTPDNSFGEAGTLPNGLLQEPTEEKLPNDEFFGELTPAPETTQLPTVPPTAVPENSTVFNEAPVEDGRLNATGDGW